VSKFRRALIGIGFLAALLLMQGLPARATPDDPSDTIKLSGIPGPYSFERLCRLSSGDLWIVGGDGIQHISSDGTVMKSVIPGAELNGVFFASADSGWVVGDRGSIFHTEDGGSKWTSQTSNVKKSLQAITCTDESYCWAVGEGGIILRTKDGGNHWKRVRSGLSTYLFAVNFVNQQTGWAAGENGIIVHTTDGGKSWVQQQTAIILFPGSSYSKRTDLLALRFIDETRGWVAGAGGIARTEDGGKTWEAKEMEGNAFIGLVSDGGKTLWAVSKGGTNYVTTDGGLTWAPANSEKTVARGK
jgi:photosystem II stability/assembly factor-like uncharacterized protein